jgi:hypothetical protein
MLRVAELFVHVCVLVDDAIRDGAIAIPSRPGPRPTCSDAEVLTIALVRHLLARLSESGFLAEVAREQPGLFPALPHQSEFNRRARWLWGAFEQFRRRLIADAPVDGWQQVDTSTLPVKHPSRVRGPDSWTGPNRLAAGFGRDAAHAEWFYGFRLAIRTDLGSRLVRAWSLVPAAVNEREVACDLLDGDTAPAVVSPCLVNAPIRDPHTAAKRRQLPRDDHLAARQLPRRHPRGRRRPPARLVSPLSLQARDGIPQPGHRSGLPRRQRHRL